MSTGPTILVITNVPADAAMIRELLEPEFGFVAVSTVVVAKASCFLHVAQSRPPARSATAGMRQ